MCAISWYLECEGVMTTGISLVRENVAAMQPPRSLWVSFPLGRPLGRANDAAFQHRVIAQALDLLDRPSGPILEDFPEDMGEVVTEQAPTCPVSFGRKKGDTNLWCEQLLRELDSLRPWYEMSVRRHGRTTVGVSKDSIEDILSEMARWLDAPSQPLPDLVWFKRAIEDAKAWYAEALTAQPGDYPIEYVEDMIWKQTELGRAMRSYYEHFSNDPNLAPFARLVASREAVGGSTGSGDHSQTDTSGN